MSHSSIDLGAKQDVVMLDSTSDLLRWNERRRGEKCEREKHGEVKGLGGGEIFTLLGICFRRGPGR